MTVVKYLILTRKSRGLGFGSSRGGSTAWSAAGLAAVGNKEAAARQCRGAGLSIRLRITVLVSHFGVGLPSLRGPLVLL